MHMDIHITEVTSTNLNVAKQRVLAIEAIPADRPIAVLPTTATEGGVPTQQDVHHHTQAPQVAP